MEEVHHRDFCLAYSKCKRNSYDYYLSKSIESVNPKNYFHLEIITVIPVIIIIHITMIFINFISPFPLLKFYLSTKTFFNT